MHLIWSTFWFCISIFVFLLIRKYTDPTNLSKQASILLSVPPLLAYSLIPFLHSIWEKIYHKFYSMWNNFFYIPTIDEILVNEEDNDEIEVDDMDI